MLSLLLCVYWPFKNMSMLNICLRLSCTFLVETIIVYWVIELINNFADKSFFYQYELWIYSTCLQIIFSFTHSIIFMVIEYQAKILAYPNVIMMFYVFFVNFHSFSIYSYFWGFLHLCSWGTLVCSFFRSSNLYNLSWLVQVSYIF